MSRANSIKVGSYLYSESEVIGKGSFGLVYKGKNLGTGNYVAIKVVNTNADKNNKNLLLRMIKNEVEALKKLSCENIVQFIECITHKSLVYIVTECCNQQDLRYYLNKYKYLEEKKAVELLRQIVNAFKEMCKKQVMHRDLKPANVLLHNGTAKLADFGFAKLLEFPATDYNSHMVSIVGTPLYMSPQLLEKQKYSTKSDIWSIGILFYEMLYGKVPWAGRDPATYLTNIKTQPLTLDRSINDISLEAEDFLLRCLKVQEADRIGWNELFEHPLITGLSISEVTTRDDSSIVDSLQAIGPERHILEYQTKEVNPSSLMKKYQEKTIQASRDILQSIVDLPTTTIDEKLKHIYQIALANSTMMKGNVYAPQSRTFLMSFNEAATENLFKSQNENFSHTNRFKAFGPESRGNSMSPETNHYLHKKSTLNKRFSADSEREIMKIDGLLLSLKNKITLLNELYDIVFQKECCQEVNLLKLTFLMTIAKLLQLLFKEFSSQILPKKIKIKSAFLDEYYETDLYKRHLVYCETEKKYFEEILKKTSRMMFDLKFENDKEKDDALDSYQQINRINEEETLLGKIIDLSNQLLYNLTQSGKSGQIFETTSTTGNKDIGSVLALFGDDSILDNFKTNKVDDMMSKMRKIKEELRKKY